MPSPFPGMDPYLESPTIWPDVHHCLISEIRAALNVVLQRRYVARVEMRSYFSDVDDPDRQALVPDITLKSVAKRKSLSKPRSLSSSPVTEPIIVRTLMDEEIEEAFIKIIHVETKEVVTIMEILSPPSKIRGSRSRSSFMDKRQEVMNSNVHWVEIDLLRAGVPSVTNPPLRPSDYRIFLSRGDQRFRTRFWPVSVRQPLPTIAIPLRGKEPETRLDLGAVFQTGYDKAGYDMSVDYRKPPQPPLEGADAKWARELLRGHK